jgi:hypothetical protein
MIALLLSSAKWRIFPAMCGSSDFHRHFIHAMGRPTPAYNHHFVPAPINDWTLQRPYYQQNGEMFKIFKSTLYLHIDANTRIQNFHFVGNCRKPVPQGL